ncbi:hypothetical protein TorRG33x02_062200 [Trema orientale]|uniref:Uncharacterized protein n=1 Tax=Trema orientale TaxID=63057 RepID=A0A2P5FJD4_TREOI|nr:hypothetical protein TorRG33x02_062200 [Trema orientale]
MKEMNVTEIPDCLIQWQWTMHAREKLSKVIDIAPRCNKSCSEESARFGYMNNLGAQMAYYSAKSETLFKMGEEMMLKSIASLKSSWEGVGDKTEGSAKKIPISKQIRNPLYTKTKGTAPKPRTNAPRTRRCSNCNNYGHNKTTCKRKRRNSLDSPRSHTSIAEDVDLADENDTWTSAGGSQSHGIMMSGDMNEITEDSWLRLS